MAPTVIPAKTLPLKAVCLGRLVSNLGDPQRDFYDHPSTANVEPIITPYSKNKASSDSDKGHTYILKLLRVLSLGHWKQDAPSNEFSARRVKCFSFNNQVSFFRDITQHKDPEGTWEWIQQANRVGVGRQLGLIVGYTTALDADVKDSKEKHKSTNLSFTAMAPGAADAPVHEVASAVASSHRGVKSKSEYGAPGEHVVAVQYQKVRISWFKKNDARLIGRKEAFAGAHPANIRGAEDPEADQVMVVDISEAEERYDFEGEDEKDDEGDEDDERWEEVKDEAFYFYR